MKIAKLVIIALLSGFFLSFLLISLDFGKYFNMVLTLMDSLKYVAGLCIVLFLSFVALHFWELYQARIKQEKLEKAITELKAKLYDQDHPNPSKKPHE
ncbi:MAG: hypothetical protein HC842_06875 [Cytophagales bacterium]|nr:hypothetical protein [Cytophagales bacterium]